MSRPALATSDTPLWVKSVIGEMATAAAGIGRLRSRSASSADSVSVAPAECPAMTIRLAGVPWASRVWYASSTSCSAAG
jgi:hypothetical protein